jgi:Fuc2NAc and GlcNAc transferase
MITLSSIIFLLIIYASSLLGTFCYKKFAIKYNIVSNINYRTLHEKPTPRGGGLVFGFVFILSIFFLYLQHYISQDLMLVFGVGAGFAGLIGYIDDIVSISPVRKLIFQSLLAFWILTIFRDDLIGYSPLLNSWHYILVASFLLVWLINAYNFIDGIDGMAISAAILIISTLVLTIYIEDSHNSIELMLILLVLLASCIGFLFFNWPTASIFMGDSGSIFLGYCFGALIVYSTMNDKISFFTWLIIFGYYLSDTTITTLIRIVIVKKWYGTHRSHAYQNLARVLENHSIVTNSIIIYHVLWLLPLAISTVLMPEFKFWALLLAFLPSIIWTVKFGPLFSMD